MPADPIQQQPIGFNAAREGDRSFQSSFDHLVMVQTEKPKVGQVAEWGRCLAAWPCGYHAVDLPAFTRVGEDRHPAPD